MEKIDFILMRLKEMSLCINSQKDLEFSIEDGNTVIDIICDEVEEIIT